MRYTYVLLSQQDNKMDTGSTSFFADISRAE